MKTVNLLWTSGWDSTYRLLELILVQKRPVQPYYVVDKQRKSLQFELKAMEKIRKLILKKDVGAKDLLLPTIFKEISQIEANETISGQYQRLLKYKKIGSQYDWLARFASEICINDLELCIDTFTPGFFTTYIKPCLIEVEDEMSCNFKLQDNPPNPDLTLFSCYRFPIHQLSKVDTGKLAKKYGSQDIMEKTWFCHYPKYNQPCGICSPCKQTIEHGLGRRISFSGKTRNFIEYNIKPEIKKFLRPGQVDFIKKVILGRTT